MKPVLILAGYGYLLIIATWLFYLAIMNLKDNKDKLSIIAKIHAYPLLIIGFTLDMLVNITIGTILFVDLPREWVLTARLKRYLYKENTKWREVIAAWLCSNLLDQFDPSKKHC